MKLTVAFLAALAAADAAQTHGRRHAKREGYGYGDGYGTGEKSSSSSVSAPSSTAAPVESPSSSYPASSSTPEVETPYPSETPSSTPVKPTTVVTPTGGYGTGESSTPAESPSSTAAPVESSSSSSSSSYPASSASASSSYPASSSTPASVETPYSSETPSSTGKGVESSSSSYPTFVGTEPYPTYPTGTGSTPESSTALPVSSGGPYYPTGASSSPYPTGTGSVPVYPGTGSSSVSDYVTSVIYSTQIFTVTACPSTVSDCPAKSTSIITSVVPVATTLCPKSSAGPSSSAIPAKGGKSSAEVETVKTPVSEITHVETQTLVYTVGTGGNKHPVTQEIYSTSTETIYKTIIITKPRPEQTPVPQTSAQAEEEEGTTTLKTTSTTTKIVTVYPTPANPSGGYGTPASTSVEAVGSVVPTGPAGGEQCAPPVTVTVTAQETVTVTAGENHSTGKPNEIPPVSTPLTEFPTGTPYPTAPYPIGNGTIPSYPTGGSSGFLTHTKPLYPTGEYPVPSSSSSSTTFVFPTEVGTEVPSSTGSPVESTSSKETPYPTPTKGYGSYRKRSGRS